MVVVAAGGLVDRCLGGSTAGKEPGPAMSCALRVVEWRKSDSRKEIAKEMVYIAQQKWICKG